MPKKKRDKPEYTGPKAIETVYNGYRFRSRLEARWAVFFDTLGVRYEYEKEGYELHVGAKRIHYLPDFWLPGLGCFVEIKPTEPDWEDPAFDLADDKLRALALETGKPAYLFFGECWFPWWNGQAKDGGSAAWVYFKRTPRFWFDGDLQVGDPSVSIEMDQWWVECAWCGAIGISAKGNRDILPCGCHRANNSGVVSITDDDPTSPRLYAAYLAARQARFEFGESGAPR